MAEKIDSFGLKALLDAEITNALGYVGKLSEQRRKAISYYYGEAKEDLSPPEVDGRSSAVSTDVSDVVEWIMPALMKIFSGGDEAVQFMPRKGGDEDAAEQMTALCNYIWEQNDGFKVYHNWFKDALIEKTGIVKIWWNDQEERLREEYENLTDLQLTLLSQDETLEIVEHSAKPAPPEVAQMAQSSQLHDVTVLKTKKKNRVCVENVPPEEFLVSRRAKSVSDAPFICHRTLKTVSDLVAAGYDKNVVMNLPTDEGTAQYNAERVERVVKDDESPWSVNQATQDPSQRTVWVAECYIRVDWDGDGIAELRKITKCGTEILDNEEIDCYPFAVISPILMPHRFFGRSIYDILAPIQRIKTAVLRGALDSIYLATNARHTAVEGQVNIDDLVASRPGGVVRVKSPGMVEALTSPAVHEGAFSALQYLDDWRENVGGVTKYNQGTDSQSLNKTATGINAVMQASNQRIELIGRVFAETGVKDAFRLIQKLLTQYQKETMEVRISGKFIPVDPRVWANEYDMTIATGLGASNKDQQLAVLQQVMVMQQQAVAAGMILPKGLMHSAEKYLEAAGFKDTENFLPLPNPQSPDPADHPQPPAPNPMVQAEQIKADASQKIAAQKAQFDAQTAQIKAQSDEAIQQARANADMQVQQHKVQTDAQLEIEKTRQQLALEDMKHSREQETALRIARIKAEAQIVAAQIAAGQQVNTASIDMAAGMDIGGGHIGALAESINNFAQAMTRPKQIIRDASGRAQGIQ